MSWISLWLLTLALEASAQEPNDFEFQPPPPPPIEGDFGDEEDGLEMDDAYMPPPPPQPQPPMGSNFQPPGAAPGRPPEPARPNLPPAQFGSSRPGDGKLRFRLLEGEFWEKGKKRGRGPKTEPR